ncbi:MAG: type VII toxin-antitoxin system MntA family adenylyltransferase antitoxin [Candidatus Asgardarchaeia archaeon]
MSNTETLDLDKIKNTLRKLFEKDDNVEFAYVFGSVIKGKTHPLSDIDVAVYLKDDSIRKVVELNAKIVDALGDNVDFVVLNKAPYSLRYIIISEGVLIFSRNENLRIDFESKAMLLGIDEKEALDAIERELIKRFLNDN